MIRSIGKFFVFTLLIFSFLSTSYYSSFGKSNLSACEFSTETTEVAELKLVPAPVPVDFRATQEYIQVPWVSSIGYHYQEIQLPQHFNITIYLSSDSSPPVTV